MNAVVGHLQPTINKALQAYAPSSSPVVKDRARLLAAKAVKTFDPKFGASLHTHVYNQLQSLRKLAPQIQDPLPLPEQMRLDRGKIYAAAEEVANNLGREPSDEEVSEYTKLPIKRVIKVRQAMRAGLPQSMIEDAGDEDEDAPDLVANQRSEMDDWVDAVYHDLGDIDRVILQYRTGYRGAPQLGVADIAKRLKISPSAVSQRASRIQTRLDEFHAPG